MAPRPRIETVFWPSCIMGRPIFDQLQVAAAGNFDSLAVAPAAIRAAGAQGVRPGDIRKRAEDLGVTFTFLDGVSGWLPKWSPTQGDQQFCESIRQRFDIDCGEALAIGAELGMTAVVAVGAFDRGALHPDVVLECFATFCRQAAGHGMRTSLEFIPFWGIPELGDAWDIVSGVAFPGAGITLDAWHMQRGTTDFERDLALLDEIAGSCPFDVQLADACPGSLWGDLLADVNFRGFAGDGSLDIARMVSPLIRSGTLKTIGPEVFGQTVDLLSPEEMGRRGGETTQAVLAIAGANAQT